MTEHDPAQPEPVSAQVAEAVADAMFALSTPSRVRILILLRARPHTVSELSAAIAMEQSAVSHQLRLLREHHLVLAERRGRERVYAINDEHVGRLLDAAIDHVLQLSTAAQPARRRARTRTRTEREAAG